jgi:two-component sensor histidine kinase
VSDQRLHFTWAESGGPLVSEPTRKSFGTRMMTSLGQQLKGKVELDYQPSGFVYRLDVPLEALVAKAKTA